MPEEATINAPSTPFASAFDAAIAKADQPLEIKEAPPEPKTETKPAKAPAEEAKKTETPRELFKKTDKPAAEPAKVEETKSAIDDIAEPPHPNAKDRAGWDTLKKEAKAHEDAVRTERARVAELEAKLAEFEPIRSKVSEYEKKLAEQAEIVARVSLEDDPSFKRDFIDRRVNLMERAKAIVDESGIDPKIIETALNLSGKPRVEALREVEDELGKIQSGRLGRVIDDLTDLDEAAAAKRAEPRKAREEYEERQRANELNKKAEHSKIRALEFEDTTRRLRGELEVLKKYDGYDDWNGKADYIVKEAKAFCDENPNADIEAEILARSIPRYRELFQEANEKVDTYEKENAELKAELKAIHGKSPSLSSRGSHAESGNATSKFDSLIKGIGE